MSLLLRDQLRIAFSPAGVELVRLGAGLRPCVTARHMVSCDAPATDEASWAKSLHGLEEGLRTLDGNPMDAMVVLSNHFVRYALVPWSDQVLDENEEQAFIHHSFSQTYGDDTQHWALRMSSHGYGETRVASAIDKVLLEELERIATARSLRLVSVQPYLMTAFNRWRSQMPGDSVWFVVVEPGRLCVSLLRLGRWDSLQTVKAGNDWAETLKNILEREFMIADSGAERGTVYLFAPSQTTAQVAKVDLPGWTVHRLMAKPDTAQDTEIQFEISMSE